MMHQADRRCHIVQRGSVAVRVLGGENQRTLLTDLIWDMLSALLVRMVLRVLLTRPPLIFKLLKGVMSRRNQVSPVLSPARLHRNNRSVRLDRDDPSGALVFSDPAQLKRVALVL